MSTIACPHCGKEMYDKLDKCPHCGGPVMSEALQQEIQQVTDEFCEKTRASEKKWLLISVIGGALGAIIFLSGQDDISTVAKIITYIIVIYAFIATIFGMHCFHPIRRWSWTILLPVIGIVIAGIIGLLVGYFGGMFYWFPRAIGRVVMKKPLLTDDEIIKMVDKGLLK
jgi:uncharacterized membrane protein YsdA (DUF1294 family)